LYQVFQAARTIYTGSLRGAGDTFWLAIISGVGAVFILGVGGAVIAALFPSLGALGPWIAAMVSIISVAWANRLRFKSKRWMDIDLFSRRPVGVTMRDGATME
jgi:Na+-driven multidrug efflux pump